MYSLTLLAFASFILALFVTPAVRSLAHRWNLVDMPGDERRIHTTPIPRIGGLAIVLAYAGAFGILFASGFSAGNLARDAFPVVGRLLPAAIVIFFTGMLDDIYGLKPWQKFAGQFAAAGLAIWAGVSVTGIAGLAFPVWISIPVTLLWIVGCANAFNLIDGVDGLATGVGLFATCTIVLAALLAGNVPLALATVPLAGALLGFLRFNFNPATIFLGDSGSLTVGFLLGCYGVLWSQKSATILGMTAPLMALAVPLMDTALSIGRRFIRGQKIFVADRGHIHHRLLDRGLTPRRVALVLYAAAACGALLSVAQSSLSSNSSGLIIVMFCAAAWIGVQHLGYVEFGVAGRMFMDGAFRRHLNAQLNLKSFTDTLDAASNPEECWRAVEAAARDFGYDHVRMHIAGRTFTFGSSDHSPLNSWTVRIPISATEYVNLERESGSEAPLDRVGPFADALQKNLRTKLNQAQAFAPPRTRAAVASVGAQIAPVTNPAPPVLNKSVQ